MPCTARQPMSQPIDCASPAIAELTTKITIAIWTSSFLSNRSASLPQIGVDAVVVSRVAVTTHVYCVCDPCRSAMIVGRALETIVADRIETNMASRRPLSASRTSRLLRVASPAGAAVAARAGRSTAVVVMNDPS